MGLVDAIKNRHSTRWYSKRPVPQEILLQVVAAGRNAVPLRPEIEVRWYIVWDGSVLDAPSCDVAGTCEDGSWVYLAPGRAGKIGLAPGRARKHDPRALVSPPHYIIAVSQKRPGFLENTGFCMEQLTLAAADRGLGTCWISALSPEGDPPTAFEQLLASMVPDLGPHERIISLTPLGYPARSQPARLAQRLVRWEAEPRPSRPQERIFWDVWGVPWIPQGAGWVAESTEQDEAWTLGIYGGGTFGVRVFGWLGVGVKLRYHIFNLSTVSGEDLRDIKALNEMGVVDRFELPVYIAFYY